MDQKQKSEENNQQDVPYKQKPLNSHSSKPKSQITQEQKSKERIYLSTREDQSLFSPKQNHSSENIFDSTIDILRRIIPPDSDFPYKFVPSETSDDDDSFSYPLNNQNSVSSISSNSFDFSSSII